MRKAVYAGSFDPITNGHLWMLEQGANGVGGDCTAICSRSDLSVACGQSAAYEDRSRRMIGDLTVRRYKIGDHDAVWNLHVLALNRSEQSRHIAGPWDDDLHAIEDLYLNDGGEFLVAEIGGVLVAMGALRRLSQTRAEIKRMRVHPDYWRQGIAQHLLSRLEILAQEKGYQILELDTTIQQEAAQKLYLKNGYQETRREQIGPFDFIFYEKRL